MILIIDLIFPQETPWKRLRIHDNVKISGRLEIGDTDRPIRLRQKSGQLTTL